MNARQWEMCIRDRGVALDDSYYVKQALLEAHKAGERGEVPVGAVVAVSYTHLVVLLSGDLLQ